MRLVKKYFTYILVAMIISGPGNIKLSSAQEKTPPAQYPGLKEIAEIFINYYPLSEPGINEFNQFNFIKDPNGWKVQVKLPQELELRIWSSTTGYPEYIDTLAIRDVLLTGLISNLSLYEYSVYSFYGYPGWKDDVIGLFEKTDRDNMSDNELYGLGRAYSLKASDILWSHSMYSDITEVQGEEARRRDLNRYLDYSESAIEAFRTLLKRSPDYKTYVGLMDVKYSNEIVARYYELRLFGFEKEANKLLRNYDPENLYDNFWISYAEAILSMVDKNAIIFTNGDNDTYPLLWLQEVRDYRRDVIIVNLSLLNDPQYIGLLENNGLEETRIKTGLTEQQLNRLGEKIILIDGPSQVQAIIPFSMARKRLFENLQSDADIITYEPGNYKNIFLNSDGLFDTITFNTGPQGKILSSAEFLVRSLIHEQAGKNSFYFTKGMQEKFSEIFGYQQMEDQGLVYKIEKPSGDVLYLDDHPYDIDALNSFTKNHPLPLPEPAFFSRKIIYDFFIESKMILLFSQSNTIVKDSMNIRMESFLKDYSPEKTGINYYYPFVAAQLYKSKADSGFVMEKIETFLDVLNNSIISTEIKDDDPRDVEQLKYYQSVIAYIKGKAYLEDQKELIKRLLEMEIIITERLLEFPELSVG